MGTAPFWLLFRGTNRQSIVGNGQSLEERLGWDIVVLGFAGSPTRRSLLCRSMASPLTWGTPWPPTTQVCTPSMCSCTKLGSRFGQSK